MLSRILVLVLLSVPTLVFAQASNDPFATGISSYQAGNFSEAKARFIEAQTTHPNSAALLYNLGLAEYRLGEIGPAIGHWRKALNLDPSLTEASQALEFAFNKLPRKELPHQSTIFESLRSAILNHVSIELLSLLLFLTLLTSAWTILGYLGLRRRAMAAGEPIPNPRLPVWLLSFLFVLSAALTALKGVDEFIPRGTVVMKTTEARVAPDASATSLFELSEGLEVLLDSVQGDWVKVTYPGGRSGWVQSSHLIQTSGRSVL